MTDLIHISVIEKYFSKIMKMDKNKVYETLEYIQQINKICPNCKYVISERNFDYGGMENAYYSGKYDLLFCFQSCAERYNQEKCVICKDNLTAVNCELCNFSLCENCHKTDDKYSWYCEDCYMIKKCNEESDNDTEDNEESNNDNEDDADTDDDDDNTCTLCEKQFDYIDLNKCDKCNELFCDECFYGYETHDSNCKVIDYEIGHEC